MNAKLGAAAEEHSAIETERISALGNVKTYEVEVVGMNVDRDSSASSCRC